MNPSEPGSFDPIFANSDAVRSLFNLEGEVLFAFFAFYASLATIFIPLTFALTATLKDQYRRSLDNPALQATNTKLFRFQELFFYYNDAFSEVIVKTAVLGIAVVASLYWIPLAERPSASLLEKSCESLVAVLAFVGLWVGSNRHMLRNYPELFFDPRGSLGTIRFPTGWFFVHQCGDFKDWVRRYATDYPQDPGWEKRALKTIPRIELANLLLVLGSAAAIVTMVGSLELPLLLLLLHSGFVLFVWWDFYVTWRPFSFLREFENVTLDPKYASKFLDDPHLMQWRTYRDFMHQYEEDDGYRAAEGELRKMLNALVPLVEASQVGLKEWKEATRQELETNGETALPVVYVGCGYLGLRQALEEGITALVQPSPKPQNEVFLITPNGSAVPRPKPSPQPQSKMFLIDSYTLDSDSTAHQRDPKLRLIPRRAGNGCTKLSGDVFHLVRCAIGAVKQVPVLENGPEPAKNEEIRSLKEMAKTTRVPPLVVLLNTTYGALIDPEWKEGENRDAREGGKAGLTERLSRMQQESIAELIALFGVLFERTGFGLLVHSKRAGWLPRERAPYTSDCWIPLRGTDSHRGVFLLGRFREEGASVWLMFCRWLNSGAFHADVTEARERMKKKAKNGKALELKAVGSVSMSECGEDRSGAGADARFIWSGASFLPPNNSS